MRTGIVLFFGTAVIAATSAVYLSLANGQLHHKPLVTVERVALYPDNPMQRDVDSLRFRGGLSLTSEDESFIGFSGLWVSSDGKHLVAVEQGHWMYGDLEYDSNGDLAGFMLTGQSPLLDESGQPFVDEADQDAEALDHDGQQFIVAFETNNRLLTYPDVESPASRVPLPPEALEGVIPQVAGLSSVASLSTNALITLAEYTVFPGYKPVYESNPTRGWLITPEGDGTVWLRASNRWLPVSLARFPEGDLLLLELYYEDDAPITRTRVSRIASEQVTIDATLEPIELAELAPPIDSARFEGASIRKGANGETLVYLVSGIADQVLIYMFEIIGAETNQ